MTTARKQWRRSPLLEPLETRQLLSGGLIGFDGNKINYADLVRLLGKRRNGVPLDFRRMQFATNDGSLLRVTLYGVGTLQGTHYDPVNDVLNVVYDNTNANSRIDAQVIRGRGNARLGSIRDRDMKLDAVDGVGGNLLGQVTFARFDLVEGGTINLSAGAASLHLGSAAANSSIYVRSLPDNPTPGVRAGTGSTDGIRLVGNPNGGVEVAETGLTPPAATGAGGAGATSSFVLPPGAFFDAAGNLVLPSGETTPIVGNVSATAATRVDDRPAGLVMFIDTIAGSPDPEFTRPAQIFGYDPAAHVLVRFDTETGAPLQTIPAPGAAQPDGAAGLAVTTLNGRLSALLGIGTTVHVLDIATGIYHASFDVSNLGPGIARVDGLGATDNQVLVTDSTSGGPGSTRMINLAASVQAGTAVAVGNPFALDRGFLLTGAATGVNGSSQHFVSGKGTFDLWQNDTFLAGLASLNPSSGQLRENSRSQQAFVNNTSIPAPIPNAALGSIENSLASVAGLGVDPETGATFNRIALFNPRNLAAQGTTRLFHPTALTALSESFHDELQGAALIDVRGTVRDFVGGNVNGLVMNVNGLIDRVIANTMSNSQIIGRPIGQVAIDARGVNVSLLSTEREVGERGGVTIRNNPPGATPLRLPVRPILS